MPSLRWIGNGYQEEFQTNVTDLGEFFYHLLQWAPHSIEGFLRLEVLEQNQWYIVWMREKFIIQDLFDSRDQIFQRIRRGYRGSTNPCGEIFLGGAEEDVLSGEAARVHAMNPIEQNEYWRKSFERALKYLNRPNK